MAAIRSEDFVAPVEKFAFPALFQTILRAIR